MNTHNILRHTKMCATAIALIFLALPCSTMQAGSLIRVLQFNLRLISSSDGNNNWYYRCNDVAAYCHDVRPDMFGLQEVTPAQRTFMINAMTEYASVGLGRDGGQTGEHCPVFYLKSKYELEKSGTFWLSDTPDKVSNTWGAACRRIVSWTILRNKQTGERLCYANTHFDHVSESARDKSSRLTKQRLREYAPGLPIIITGDYNCTPTSTCYQRMIEPDGTFPMHEAWRDARIKEGYEGTFHSWGTIAVEKRSRIDFIFHTPDIKSLRCVTDDSSKRPRMLSDHDTVYADLELP